MAPHLTFLIASTGRTFLDHEHYSAVQSCNFVSQWLSFFFNLSYIYRMLLLRQDVIPFYRRATFKYSSPWLLFFPPALYSVPQKTISDQIIYSVYKVVPQTVSCIKAAEQTANWDADWERVAAEKMGQEILGHCGHHTLHMIRLWQEGH